MLKDLNGNELNDGDVIDIHQTVNGQNLFIVVSVFPTLDIRYGFDIMRKYEYDKQSLLSPCCYSGEVGWEIICKFPKKLLEQIMKVSE